MSWRTPAMIFIDTKYTKTYFSIISNAKSRTLSTETYTENHHIIPKSLGGSDDKSNIVALTAREHFICHWLLTKMVTGDYKKAMHWAFHGMSRVSRLQQRYSTKITSTAYETNKKNLQWTTEMRNKRKGYSPSPETREKMSIATKGRIFTEEHKQKLRTPKSEETKRKLSELNKGKSNGPMTEEAKAKFRETLRLKKLKNLA